jgi:hypothetical protein
MTTLSNSPQNVQLVTFTEESLAYALATVRCYGDRAPDLIAREVFQQLAQLICNSGNISPAKLWLTRSGGYTSKLEAVQNGEQLIAPAEIAWRLPT